MKIKLERAAKVRSQSKFTSGRDMADAMKSKIIRGEEAKDVIRERHNPARPPRHIEDRLRKVKGGRAKYNLLYGPVVEEALSLIADVTSALAEPLEVTVNGQEVVITLKGWEEERGARELQVPLAHAATLDWLEEEVGHSVNAVDVILDDGSRVTLSRSETML